jgi:hypothetical protein
MKNPEQKKVDQETALKDFERWLEIKRIRDQKRQENAKSKHEDVIISSIIEGDISIDENGYITHRLIFPINDSQGANLLEELRYIPRIPQKLLNIKLKGVDATDGDKRIIAYASALTQQNMGLIEQMDTEDQRIMQAIVMYFL